MKTLSLIFSLLMLASCNDALRTRIGRCRSSSNQAVICNDSNALKTEKFRKMYIAEISTTIEVGQSQIILKDYAEDSDHDWEFSCDLQLSANKQFSYSFESGKLVLKDGMANLRLTKSNGFSSDGLIGTWVMQETVGKVTTVTELTFKDLEELSIKKTCNLK